MVSSPARDGFPIRKVARPVDVGTLNIFKQMVVLFALLALGYVCKKAGVTNRDLDKGLTRLVINVTFPCMAVGAVLTAENNPSVDIICFTMLFSCVMQGMLFALAFIVTKLLGIQVGSKGVFRFMLIFGNVGFLGFPVVSALYGSDAIIYASIFGLPFNLLCYSVGPIMVASDVSATPQKITWRNFTSPAILSCAVSIVLALLDVHNVPVITDVAVTAGNMTTPAAMIIIGSQLANLGLREALGGPKLWLMCAFRLIINPFIVWCVLHIFIADPLILGVLVVTSAMPVANVAVMFSLLYGGNDKVASQGVFVSTVLSMITIPLLVLAMG